MEAHNSGLYSIGKIIFRDLGSLRLYYDITELARVHHIINNLKPGTDGDHPTPSRTDGDPQPAPARGTTITVAVSLFELDSQRIYTYYLAWPGFRTLALSGRSPGHGHRDWHGVAGRRPRRWLATVKAKPIVTYHLRLRLTAGSLARTESRWAYLIQSRVRQSESLESGRGPGPKPTGTAPT
jgi:hypothetical protein